MDEMRKTVGNAAILSAVIAVVMTAVSMLGNAQASCIHAYT